MALELTKQDDCCTEGSCSQGVSDRASTVSYGKKLEYFTIAWNSLEAFIAIGSGILAGSVALVGFGFDSVIEVNSGVALLWRLNVDDSSRREYAEKLSLRLVGASFLALAAYVTYDSITSLLLQEAPDESRTGIALAASSLFVMPLLARAKRKVAITIGSSALTADARQTQLCTYLSANSTRRLGAKRGLGVVVGRSGCSTRDAPHHRERGHRRTPKKDLLLLTEAFCSGHPESSDNPM